MLGQGAEDHGSQHGQGRGSRHAVCTAYNARLTYVPWCACRALKEARTPLRRCHSRCVLSAGRRTPPQEWGTTGVAWEGPSFLQIDK